MKYIFLINFLLFLFSANAQESIIFKQEFLPNKTYNSEIKMILNSEVKAIGDPEIIAQLKKEGFTSPMVSKSENYIETSMKTQNELNGKIPFEISYDKFNSKQIINGEELNVPIPLDNAKIKGTITEGMKMNVESLEGINLDDEFKQTLIQSIENLTQKIEFPEQPMKIGDKFNLTVPMQVPMPGIGNLDFDITTEYLLKKIENGIADFDYTQTMTSK